MKDKGEIIMKKIITIEGMSCMHCVGRVKNALSGLEGLSNIEVEKGKAVAEGSVSNEVIKEAIEDLGFDVVNIEE